MGAYSPWVYSLRCGISPLAKGHIPSGPITMVEKPTLPYPTRDRPFPLIRVHSLRAT